MAIARFMLRFFVVNTTAGFCLGGIQMMIANFTAWRSGDLSGGAVLPGILLGLAALTVGAVSIADLSALFEVWGATKDDGRRTGAAIRRRAAANAAQFHREPGS